MIKVLLAVVLLFLIFFFGLKTVRSLSSLEAWRLTKLVAYSILCSLLTVAVLIAIVVIF